MAFWYYVAFYIATLVIGELLRPKPEHQEPRPAALGDFRFPTATEGRPIPVCWGKNRIKGANLVWYGDYRAKAVTDKVKTGLFSSDKVTLGYRYQVGMHFVLCHAGLDAITGITMGEKSAWAGSAMNTTVYVDKRGLFGGEEKEGGLQGYFAFQDGNAAQAVDPYLDAMLADAPAYRGVSGVVFYGPSGATLGGGQQTGYVGTTPYLKNIAFDVERYPDGLGNGYHQVGDEANPAECLFELLTDEEWGAGIPAADIDLPSFQAAAQTLHGEGHGFSLLWDRQSDVRSMAQEILRQVDGLIYTDPASGQLTLALARDDYDVGTLPVLDESNVLSVEQFTRGSWDTTLNELVLSYVDSNEEFAEKSVAAHNAANWQAQGAIASEAITMPGIRNAQLAADVAMRELKAQSFTPARGTLIANRTASGLRPGQPFKYSNAELGITDLVMRVQNIRLGDLVEGQVMIDAVQDIFGLASATYAPPQPSGWSPVINAPQASPDRELGEAFYWANQGAGEADPRAARIAFAARAPSTDALSFKIESRLSGGTWVPRGTATEFTPTGTLDADYPKATAAVDTTNTLTINPGADLDQLASASAGEIENGANLLLIDAEIMAYEVVTPVAGGKAQLGTLWRGLFDTVPADHSAGAEVWFISHGYHTTEDHWNETDTVQLRLMPSTASGTLDSASAPVDQHTITARADRPYRPGNVTVNGSRYPDTIVGDLSLGWAHRDVTQEYPGIVKDNAASIGPEAGVTYTLRIYDEFDVLIRTETGLAGTGYNYPNATEVADSGRTNNRLRFELEAVRGGVVSHQMINHEVTRS